jgi:hypothetical protein
VLRARHQLFGGSAVVSWFGLTAWASSFIGIMRITGICFAVSVIFGWWPIRALFEWINKNKGKDIPELAEDIKDKLTN